ncbi:MAG: hypothetical protein WAZ18_00225 [Alphaproteobacteria bacterium]
MSDFLKTVTGNRITGLGHKLIEPKPHLDDQVVAFAVEGLLARLVYHHAHFKGLKQSKIFNENDVRNILNDGYFRLYLQPLKNESRAKTLLDRVCFELMVCEFDVESFRRGKEKIRVSWDDNDLDNSHKR